uniref:Uncharacterized protein n=1 Tax=Pararge aegeria TaxID=116150 RepID=S4PK51_9NEOP
MDIYTMISKRIFIRIIQLRTITASAHRNGIRVLLYSHNKFDLMPRLTVANSVQKIARIAYEFTLCVLGVRWTLPVYKAYLSNKKMRIQINNIISILEVGINSKQG